MLSVFQTKSAKLEAEKKPESGPEPDLAEPIGPVAPAQPADIAMPDTDAQAETLLALQEHDLEHEDGIPPPPEPIRWFHAVDSPLTKPHEPRRNLKTPPPPRKPATTWVPFSIRDSNALERAYQLTQPSREERVVSQETAAGAEGAAVDHTHQEQVARLHVPDPNGPNVSASLSSSSAGTSILVNEDYLFQVNIQKMEIKPVYWLGPTYEVRRAVWFLQLDGKFVPCEANLTQQIEYGYNKHRPWIAPPPTLDASGKEVVEVRPEKSWALLGKYISQYVVFTDAHHAWLLSDDLKSKFAKTIFTKVSLTATLGGAHLIRGYDEVEKFVSKKASEDAAQKKKDGTDTKKKETSEIQKKREAAQSLQQKTKRLTEEEKDTIQESHEIDDYSNEEENEERTIDHLVLVIHGVGQKLGDRMEAINFIHDVNVMRRTMKETAATFVQQSPGNATPKDQAGGAEKDKEATSKMGGSTASKNPYAVPSGSGVQVLPVEWRRQITFGMANEDEELQRDLSTPEAEEGCPTMEDIMLDGVPTIRMLVSDVLMDVLLYMTPSYKRKMMEVVTNELNRVYRSFVHHNPDFLRRGGKVSILGHSLGSLLALDILNHQPFSPMQYQPIPSSPVYEKFISFDQGMYNPVSLDFPVTNFFALGSPIGLFLLLKGCKLGARLSDASTTDPVAHRVEPLISRSFGSKTRPALIPYHKGGLKGLHIGIQDFSNDLANRANTMIESVKMGITTSMFTRALGFRTNPMSNAAVIHSVKVQEAGGASGLASETEMSTIIDGSELVDGALSQANGSTTPRVTPEMNSMISKAKVKALNKTGRVDWCLQEGVFENAYLSALSVHMQYWSDSDVAAFIIRQTYDMDSK
ncbi:DDHD domain-containing protein [Gamsiella multidivaricata]|uniref:DDHD domain-containing protein n=1 Tax=Gamsiella multidivaricata TaxID=101098 RepID=UPI0022201D36|nr:DDHD domain-containing protein [Gamsiella multidivaricata]KAI7816832.1 DDHD domain-containing protein [Gamsiella multidivaricata]